VEGQVAQIVDGVHIVVLALSWRVAEKKRDAHTRGALRGKLLVQPLDCVYRLGLSRIDESGDI